MKIVVTDDRGRYLVPDLPKANYNVWVRGYGLVDSPKVAGDAGQDAEPDGGAGAERARGGAVLSGRLLVLAAARCPDKSEFPGTGAEGNGISPNMKSQAEWIRTIKSGGCTACHQLGTKGTREIPDGARHVPDRRSRRGSGACSPGRRARR